MIKNILALIGAIVLVVGIGAYVKMGSAVSGLDKGALPAYMAMFDEVLKNGDPAKAMTGHFQRVSFPQRCHNFGVIYLNWVYEIELTIGIVGSSYNRSIFVIDFFYYR